MLHYMVTFECDEKEVTLTQALENELEALKQQVADQQKKLDDQAQLLMFYDLAVQKYPQSVWMLDDEGNIIICSDYLNELLANLCDKPRQNFAGQNLYELMSEKHASIVDMLKRHDKKVLESKASVAFEEIVPLQEEIKTYLAHKKSFQHPYDGKTYLLGVSIDITERKNMENEMLNMMKNMRLADRTKRTFIQNFRHDLKTPISNIIGAADLLIHSKGTKDTSFFLETIKSSGMKLLSHIDQLTDVSNAKVEMPLDISPVDIRSETRSVTDSVEAIAEAKKLKIAVHIDENVPDEIMTDQLRYHRILANLLSNALKYTETGQVSIEINYVKAGKMRCLEIHVVDTGVGIEEKFQQLIFSPLMRIRNEMSESDGAGLGLSIVREFINDLSGQIAVSSAEGMGSRFTVTLPIQT